MTKRVIDILKIVLFSQPPVSYNVHVSENDTRIKPLNTLFLLSPIVKTPSHKKAV